MGERKKKKGHSNYIKNFRRVYFSSSDLEGGSGRIGHFYVTLRSNGASSSLSPAAAAAAASALAAAAAAAAMAAAAMALASVSDFLLRSTAASRSCGAVGTSSLGAAAPADSDAGCPGGTAMPGVVCGYRGSNMALGKEGESQFNLPTQELLRQRGRPRARSRSFHPVAVSVARIVKSIYLSMYPACAFVRFALVSMSLTLPTPRGRRRGAAICSSASLSPPPPSRSLSLSLRVDNNKRKIALRGERNSEGLFLAQFRVEGSEVAPADFLSFSFFPPSFPPSQRCRKYLFQSRGGQERSSDASAIQVEPRS